jgi:hypothetical protein
MSNYKSLFFYSNLRFNTYTTLGQNENVTTRGPYKAVGGELIAISPLKHILPIV